MMYTNLHLSARPVRKSQLQCYPLNIAPVFQFTEQPLLLISFPASELQHIPLGKKALLCGELRSMPTTRQDTELPARVNNESHAKHPSLWLVCNIQRGNWKGRDIIEDRLKERVLFTWLRNRHICGFLFLVGPHSCILRARFSKEDPTFSLCRWNMHL